MRGPAQYPRFVLFGNFLENASDGGGARHTHARASLPRTPTNLPSFPQSLADPNLNLPHRRLPPPPHTEQTQIWPRRDSRSTPPASRPRASRAPPDGASLRNRHPRGSRVRSRLIARFGGSAAARARVCIASRRENSPQPHAGDPASSLRRDSRIFFALGADEAAPLSPTVAP